MDKTLIGIKGKKKGAPVKIQVTLSAEKRVKTMPVKKAPKEVIEKEQNRLKSINARIDELKKAIDSLT